MSQASDVELLMLNLINEERTSRGLNALKINNALNEVSEDHSQWMLDNNVFDHTGVGGSSAGDRIAASDYELEGRWQTAENIGVQSLRGEPGIADDVAQVHQSLMNSPGHRANLLNPNLEDIGIGIEVGDFTYDGGFSGESVMVTQNFGRTDAEQTPPPAAEDDVNDTPPTAPETPPAEEPVADAPETEDPVEEPAPEVPSDDEDTDMADVPVPTPVNEPDMEETPAPDPSDDDDEDVAEVPADDVFECPAFDNMFVFATRFSPNLADMFEFNDMPAIDDDSVTVASAFEGAIATPEGTVTTSDPYMFSELFAEVFATFDIEWM